MPSGSGGKGESSCDCKPMYYGYMVGLIVMEAFFIWMATGKASAISGMAAKATPDLCSIRTAQLNGVWVNTQSGRIVPKYAANICHG